VAVDLEGERWGVVAHPALQAQDVHAGFDQQRCAGVAQGVKADARKTSSSGCGNEHAAAKCSGVRRSAVAAGKHERVVSRAGRAQLTQRRGEPDWEWHEALAVP
jgi:hypothetical protein